MASVSEELRERYRQALTAYISGSAEETELIDTLGLGRLALDQNCGLVELLSTHRSVLLAVIAELPRATVFSQIAAIAKAEEFLTQVAAPFELTHLGWREAIDHLRRLNESLEHQVAERTAALRASERRFQDIAEVSGDWMWETDGEHRFTLVTGERAGALSIRGGSLIGLTRWEGADADPKTDELWARHKADLDAHQPFRHFRYETRSLDGVHLFISASGKPVFDSQNNFLGYRGTATDETVTVEARRKTEAAEAMLRDAIESISGGFLICDAEDKLVTFNQRFRRTFEDCVETLNPGARYEEFLREAIRRGCYQQAVGREDAWYAERMAQHLDANTHIEVQLREDRWVLVTERRMSNGGTAMVSIDISSLKAAQKALADREGQLNRAQRLARMGSDLRDLRTGERVWSDETYRIFGVCRETFEATLENVFNMIHPEDQPIVVANRAKTAAGECPAPFEYRIIRPNGEVRHVYREWELIRDEAGNPAQLLGTIHDITDRRQTEEQLRQAQKMEAIGNLTGGMAHDFNNLLGVIVGNLGLVRDEIGDNEELAEMVGEALDAAWRGADLTRRLLAFARRQPLRPARIEVNKLIADTVRLLRRLLGEDIEVRLELAADVWPIIADPAQLEASVANLATNARDAMPRGGRLIIATANRHLDAKYVAEHAEASEGDFAMVEVSDTGTGMTAEVMRRIFEPFFTTKEEGKGTGLGLSMVFGFLRQSGGHVFVYSEPGAGTTFRLYLPRATSDVQPTAVRVAAAVGRGGGEVVLVVEDNPSVRRIVLRQLRNLGYRALECESAVQALDLLQHEPVDLLFTDIVMPGGLDGVELARLARERWPALKIVLTSGFPQARIDTIGDALDGIQLLSKPYIRQELAAVLHAALHE